MIGSRVTRPRSRRSGALRALLSRVILLMLALQPAVLTVNVTRPSAFALIDTPPANRLPMNLDLLPATPFQTVGYGLQSFNSLAAAALDVWNRIGVGIYPDHQFFSLRTPSTVGDPCRRDGINEVRFASTICALDWGDAIGLTFTRSINGRVVETDVLFNVSVFWDAYPGPRGSHRSTDFYRVAVHEFGHAAGLDHPDEAGQTVTALMNSQIGDVDAPQADDTTGVRNIFWGPPCAGDGSGPVNAVPLGAFVTALYQTVLGRAPGTGDVAAWTGYLAANANLAGVGTVVHAFFDAPEYRNRPVTPWLHVFLLFRAMLGRDPNAGELGAWAEDVLNRVNPVVGLFGASAEFRNLVPNLQDSAAVAAAVTRLYLEALGRSPTAPELGSAVQLVLATGDFIAIAVQVFDSVEYLQVPRTLAQHVTVLFRALLARNPGLGEVAAWVGVFGARLSPMVDAVASSAEFQARCPALFR